MGSERAGVKVVVFADFTCVHCATLHLTLDSLTARFPDQVVVVFKHFPISRLGYQLALASECLADKGAFKAFYDAAFSLRRSGITQDDVTPIWERITSRAGFNPTPAIRQCVDGEEKKARVESDVSDARRIQLAGTPALLVNGTLYRGAVPLPSLVAVVREKLDPTRPVPTAWKR